MPWSNPSLQQIIEQANADVRAELPSARPELRRSLLSAVVRSLAGIGHGLYGYLDWQADQLLPDTAEDEILLRWANIWGVERDAAEPATGSVTFTGAEGAQIVAGTLLESDSGQEYSTDATVSIDGTGSILAAVTAVTAGADGNLDAGESLSLVSAVPGVDANATVDANGLAGGADQEKLEQVREELLDRIQRPPHGGSESDYEQWALDGHPDVTRAWVYPNELDPGTVTVRIVCDDLADIIPTQQVLDTVQGYVDSQRPVQVPTYVVAPIAKPLDLDIQLIPDSTEARARVTSAIEDWLEQAGKPGVTLYLTQLNGVIYVAAGDSRHVLSSPSADVTHAFNEIPVMGTITWL